MPDLYTPVSILELEGGDQIVCRTSVVLFCGRRKIKREMSSVMNREVCEVQKGKAVIQMTDKKLTGSNLRFLCEQPGTCYVSKAR